ncbi:MAG: S8 family serine peptidase [Acidobacteria bacterium]|nr:S8 family serine peptidase [Acidobacteriota bacterium]
MAVAIAGTPRARAFVISALLAAAAAVPARAAVEAPAPAPYRGPLAPSSAAVSAGAGPGAAAETAERPAASAGSWRGPLLLGLGSAGPSGADPGPDQLLARPHAILFDAAAFEPLADGEPDLSPFAPEPEGFESLASDTPRLALVQFAAPPGPAQRAALAEMGVEPLFAVPREAYLVRADAVALGRAAGLSGVRWVGRFRPGYKFDRRLARAAAGRPAPSPLPGEGLDAFRVHALALPGPGRSAADLAAAVAAADPSVLVEGASSDGTVALLALSVPRIRLREALARLAALEEVVALEPRGEVAFHNDDAVWIGQSYDRFWKRNYSKSATVWKRGLLGDGELIGIADSGVDPDVCWMIDDPKGLPPVSSVPADGALAGPIPVDLTRRKIVAYNLLGSFQAQATAYDVRSGDPHGTWTAVSAAGDDPTNPATESNPLGPHHDAGDGVAPMAKLVVEDLGDDQGNLVGLGLPIPLMVDRMFEQMRDAGARISTNSWGISHNEYDTLAFFTDRMVWNHPDFLIVFSAGNSGPFAGSLASPGTAKNVLTVGASDSRIQADPDPTKALDPENVAEFSSRGPTSDGRLKPDIMMSGRSLVTGTSDRRELGRTCSTLEVNGTSFAAPLVAGYAALAREYFRKGFYPSGAARAADALTPSAALLKATLLAGARNMTGRGGADYGPCVPDTCDLTVGLCFNGFGACSEDADCWTCSGKSALTCAGDRDCNLALLQDDAPTPEQGWGRLQLDDALYFSGDTRGLALWDVPRDRGVATSESWSSEVYLDGRAEELKIVLTWPDPPALVASPSYLVNDLDLVVTAPNGTTYRGNAWAARDRNPVTREATAPNAQPVSDNDNVEMVRLPAGGAPPGLRPAALRLRRHGRARGARHRRRGHDPGQRDHLVRRRRVDHARRARWGPLCGRSGLDLGPADRPRQRATRAGQRRRADGGLSGRQPGACRHGAGERRLRAAARGRARPVRRRLRRGRHPRRRRDGIALAEPRQPGPGRPARRDRRAPVDRPAAVRALGDRHVRRHRGRRRGDGRDTVRRLAARRRAEVDGRAGAGGARRRLDGAADRARDARARNRRDDDRGCLDRGLHDGAGRVLRRRSGTDTRLLVLARRQPELLDLGADLDARTLLRLPPGADPLLHRPAAQHRQQGQPSAGQPDHRDR